MENNRILAYENIFCIVYVGEKCKVRTKVRNHKVVRQASEKNIKCTKCTQKHKNVWGETSLFIDFIASTAASL